MSSRRKREPVDEIAERSIETIIKGDNLSETEIASSCSDSEEEGHQYKNETMKENENAGIDNSSLKVTVTSSLSESNLKDLQFAELESKLVKQASNLSDKPKGLKVLFLSSDTGGGHRASAESLGKQFQILFPFSTYELLDVVEKDGVPPYNSLVSSYKHLSAHPTQWKLVYSVSNSRAFEVLADAHLKLMCERAVRRRIKSYDPDVVVSVHPLMTNVPVLSCSKISAETGKKLPIFTVVTDLGSAHCLWFANGVEKMFVGSEAVKELAKSRGKVPEEKLVMAGLPIRVDFAVQADRLGERYSPEGKAYQLSVRQDLKLPPMTTPVSMDSGVTDSNESLDRKTILIMGGGEGVGSLERITESLYCELVSEGIDALILVVCGRNDKLKDMINKRDWMGFFKKWYEAKNTDSITTGIISSLSFTDACGPNSLASTGCIESGAVTGRLRKILSRGSRTVENAMYVPLPSSASTPSAVPEGITEDEKKANEIKSDEADEKKIKEQEMNAAAQQLRNSVMDDSDDLPAKPNKDDSLHLVNSLETDEVPGNVSVVGLGFVTKMAEYMVAADILISKAGPGTISEAAALSLPVMLTSFLPGQEEGNVDYVVNGGFGTYIDVSDPVGIAEEVCSWLQNEEKMRAMSAAAKAKGAPHAARDIAQQIGDATLMWKELNQKADQMRIAKSTSVGNLPSKVNVSS